MAPSPDDQLDEDGKRCLRRGSYGIMGCMLAGLISYCGLFYYMMQGQSLDWVFWVWLVLTAVATRVGCRIIAGRLDKRLGPLVSRDKLGNIIVKREPQNG